MASRGRGGGIIAKHADSAWLGERATALPVRARFYGRYRPFLHWLAHPTAYKLYTCSGGGGAASVVAMVEPVEGAAKGEVAAHKREGSMVLHKIHI